MTIPRDFREWFALLNSHRVEYAVVGGYAVAFHGAPRFTGDIDVLVGTDPENARRLLAALDAFGFGSLGLGIDDFTQPDRIVQLGVPPMRIDLLTGIDGVDWTDVLRTRVTTKLEDVEVAFISVDLLRANKRSTGRAKDRADLESLGSGE